MPITKLSPREAQEAIQEWKAAVHTLFQEVQQWAAEERPDWQIESSSADVIEASSGSYVIPVLEISNLTGRLILEPVGRDVIGAKGRIDLYAWPSLYRVMLLRSFVGDEWVIRTESGIDWPQFWGKTSFLTIADQLMSAS